MTPKETFPEDPFSSDPELEAMAREFKRTFREEQEELEAMSQESLEAEIDMTFAFLELMWSGARARLTVGERFFEGFITHVGRDIVQLDVGPGMFDDIHIPINSQVFDVERPQNKGRAAIKRDPRTFIARMRELAAFHMQEVEMGGETTAGSISGILKLVRSDHVVIAAKDKREWLVPLNNVGYCLTRGRSR